MVPGHDMLETHDSSKNYAACLSLSNANEFSSACRPYKASSKASSSSILSAGESKSSLSSLNDCLLGLGNSQGHFAFIRFEQGGLIKLMPCGNTSGGGMHGCQHKILSGDQTKASTVRRRFQSGKYCRGSASPLMNAVLSSTENNNTARFSDA